MASPPAKNAAPRASSVLSQDITAATAAVKPAPAGAPLKVTTKQWVTLRRVFFTAEDVGQAQKLFDILNRMQESLLQALGVVTTNQLIPGNILRAITFTAGQTQMLAHGLGREWQGYFCIRARSGSGACVLTDEAYTTGLTADLVVPLKSVNAGVYDIYVF